MTVRIDIVSGFLGTGKTTFITKMLSQSDDNENTVIIENEFGEIGIDGDVLKDYKIQVKEIRAGCICCSLVGEFKDAIQEFIETFNPNRIIIEPSGVGRTSEIINGCLSSPEDIQIGNIITVVDPNKYFMHLKNFKDFYKDQIVSANIIVLSRTQLIDEDKVRGVAEDIKRLNPHAIVEIEPWDNLVLTKYDKVIYTNLVEEVRTLKHYHEHDHHHHHDDIDFEDFCFVTDEKYTEKKLEDMFKTLSNQDRYGNIIRAKGILNSPSGKNLKVDYVTDELNIEEVDYDGMGRICFIGLNLGKDHINDLLNRNLR